MARTPIIKTRHAYYLIAQDYANNHAIQPGYRRNWTIARYMLLSDIVYLFEEQLERLQALVENSLPGEGGDILIEIEDKKSEIELLKAAKMTVESKLIQSKFAVVKEMLPSVRKLRRVSVGEDVDFKQMTGIIGRIGRIRLDEAKKKLVLKKNRSMEERERLQDYQIYEKTFAEVEKGIANPQTLQKAAQAFEKINEYLASLNGVNDKGTPNPNS